MNYPTIPQSSEKISEKNTLQKKICMLGDFSVGKTSLVSRFVHNYFSEAYLTTIGVRIDSKIVETRDVRMNMILWDLAGEDRFESMRDIYLKGCAGYFLVADVTRPRTFDTAMKLQLEAARVLGNVPFVFLINKIDLIGKSAIDKQLIRDIARRGWRWQPTSAKKNDQVDEAFQFLATQLLER